MRHVGIDVGGTKCHGVAVDGDGTVVAEVRRPTPHASELVEILSGIFTELGGETTLGIGLPGLITPDGVVVASPNMRGANNVPVGPGLRAALGAAVHVENDATLAAYGEWKAGAALGARDAVMVTLGTGIGGGIVMGGELQRGAHGFAGEIGHMMVVRDGIECPCGRRGCWERYASGTALRDLAGGIEGPEIIERSRRGDAHATTVVREFADWIAVGLASLTNICDPEVIVIGGGVVESFDVIMPLVDEFLGQRLYSSAWRPRPRVTTAMLGERAGAVGGALIAGTVFSG